MQKSTHTSLVTAILLSASSCFKKAADLKVYKKVGLSKNGKSLKVQSNFDFMSWKFLNMHDVPISNIDYPGTF